MADVAAEIAPETRRDVLSSALEKASAPEVSGSAKEAGTVHPATGEVATPETSRQDHGKDGKFAKGNAAARKPAEVVTEPLTPAEVKKAREYPGTWKKDYEPVYRKLEANPEFSSVLDEIERREGDMKKGFEGNKALADYAQRFQRTLQPFEQTLRQLNLQPDVAVQRLMAADHALRYGSPAHKQQLAMQFLQGYGIDPATLNQEQAQIDPQQNFLLNRLQMIEQQNQTLLSSFEQQMQADAEAQVTSFKKDHPHFDEVREEMGRLIDKGVCQTLPEAYDRAIYGIPATREKVLAEQRDKAEAERKQKAQAEAAAAKTAAVQVKGAPSGNAQSASLKAKDRRAQLAEVASRLS